MKNKKIKKFLANNMRYHLAGNLLIKLYSCINIFFKSKNVIENRIITEAFETVTGIIKCQFGLFKVKTLAE